MVVWVNIGEDVGGYEFSINYMVESGKGDNTRIYINRNAGF